KPKYPIFKTVNFKRRILLVTAHRRESFGGGLQDIFSALKRIVHRFKDVEIVYPVHLNPNVAEPAHQMLGSVERIHLMRPFTYEETYWIMDRCYAILTDSGGIQEEAPCFRKPVLVLRNVTERTEGIAAGVAKLVGTNGMRIFKETEKLLTSPKLYRAMRARVNPYGDGKSSQRIVQILTRELRKPGIRSVKQMPRGLKVKASV
ncbi:MAG: UDP-N-acetylglucosamine 2-epimerase (non-hydrolyzing), partial [Candidatus Omnitrophica bacterium]|nr:UDP-N-acetylglucosamine 2-epimerase (non-hydrolyzing) [Candidatus Omnitrophota bacterium]